MDVAGAAVGVASLGIQVCQGLLDYYQACESYDRDIQEAQKWIMHLQRTLVILGDVLQSSNAKQDVFQNAQTGILNCEDGILKLEKKLRKIRKGDPSTAKERTKAMGHRLIYPFQQSTVAKLKEIVKDLFEHLLLSIQVLQVDTDFNTQALALHINDTVTSISASTTSLQGAARSQQAQMARLSDNVESVQSGTVAIRKELIGLPDQISQAVAGLLSTIRIGELTKRNQLDQRSSRSRLFDVLNWLKAPDPSAHHLRARKAHTPGTGQWLFGAPEFKSWVSGRCSWLWISGLAGSGKTILCSQAIEHLANQIRHQRSEVIAYFYFSRTESHELPPYQMLLLSLIVQLADRQGDLLPDLQDAFAQDDKHIGVLESIVLQLLHLHVRVYIVIDALDECPLAWCHRQNVLDGLHRLSGAAKHVRILVTSRSGHLNVEGTMQRDGVESLTLDPALMQDDIRLHLDGALGRAEFREATASTLSLCMDVIQDKADGSFLCCEFNIQELVREPLRTDARLLQASEALPGRLALDTLFTSKISGIADSNRESASSLLLWIAYARRPLTVVELVAITRIEFGGSDTAFESGADTIYGLLGAFRDMLHISDAVTDRSDFVYHDQAQPSVEFVHETVREYLVLSGFGMLRRSSTSWDVQDAHATLARSCVRYLSQQGADARNAESPRSTSFPFLEYAMNNWQYHLEQAQTTNDLAMEQRLHGIKIQAESLLENNESMQAQSRSLIRKFGALTFRPLESDIHDPSHDQIQGSSSRSSTNTHRLDTESRLVRCFTTPLQQACFKGNTKLVNRLIKRGANVNAQSGKFCSALHVAAYYGHVDTVTALLEAGANIDLEGGCFGTALQGAIAGDHDEVVDILLDRGADVNTCSAIAEPSDINDNGPDYYDLPVKEMKRVTTE